MKKLIPHIIMSSLLAPVLFLLASINVSAQEYDDMYFTAGDRKKAKFLENQQVNEGISEVNDNESELEYSPKTVNPDYLAKYNRGVANKRKQNQDTSAEYYVEDYNRDVIINNYYVDPYRSSYSSWNRWNYDPFFDPYWSSSWNYRPGWNYYSGWHVSIGFGNYYRRPYYSPWSYHNPYYYDRYYSSYYWDSPYYGYNRYYGGYHNHYYYGHYTVSKNQLVYNNETNRYQLRDVRRGSYTSRSSSGVSNNTSRRQAVANSSTNGRVSNYRDQTSTQNDYYRRTRVASGTSSNTTEGARRNTSATINSRNESARTNNAVNPNSARSSEYYNTRSYTTRDRSNNNNSNTYRPPVNSGNNRTEGVSPASRSRSESTTPSRSNYTPSRSGSSQGQSTTPARTYTPSRSSGSQGNTPARTYTPSRSSGSDSRSSGSSYSPSRSSGSSGGSYTPSRSSGSSSGTAPSRSSSGSGGGRTR